MSRQSESRGFTRESFTFLEALEVNNNREWFNQHREMYEHNLREPFIDVLEGATEALAKARIPFQGGEQTMFRINRDVRFSTDKSPYSTHLSGVLTPTGRKDLAQALIYLQLNSDGGLLAAGLYRPDVARLTPLRHAMLDEQAGFARVLGSLRKSSLALDDEESTRTMPRGFAAHADHPHAPYVRMKNIMVTVSLTRNDWISGSIPQRIASFASDVKLLVGFINDNS